MVTGSPGAAAAAAVAAAAAQDRIGGIGSRAQTSRAQLRRAQLATGGSAAPAQPLAATRQQLRQQQQQCRRAVVGSAVPCVAAVEVAVCGRVRSGGAVGPVARGGLDARHRRVQGTDELQSGVLLGRRR